MRKFLLIAMVIMTLPVFAQNYTMRVAGFMAEDSWEAYDYVYGSTNGTDMLCVNKHDFITPMEYIDSLKYDENGRIITLGTWQQLDGNWVYTCRCDYTYNENGLRATRKNYNSWDGGVTFDLGGIFNYFYDEEGRMTEWTLDFAGVEYQKGIISYNDKGQKEAEVIMEYNFATYYQEETYLTEYEYDANGNMVKSIEFMADETGTWVPQMIRINEFDEFNNCTLNETRTSGGTVQEKYVYKYDVNYLAENIYHYENPEQDFPVLPQMNNLLKSFEFHAANDNGELVHVTDYLLNYEVIADAVNEMAFNSNIYPNPAQDFVMIESSEVDYVEVLDVYGRVMFATEMSEMLEVDMSEYTSGIYFVRLHANEATSVQKIMKK